MTTQELACPGDVLFYRVTPHSPLLSRLIGLWEKITGEGRGTYSHVALVGFDTAQKYEATWPRVATNLIDWTDPRLELWRIKGLDSGKLALMLTEAKNRVGDWYGLGKSLKALVRSKQLEVCSTYIVIDAKVAGIDLQEGRKDPFVSPDELAKSPLLFKVA